jgi:hypothetical protein
MSQAEPLRPSTSGSRNQLKSSRHGYGVVRPSLYLGLRPICRRKTRCERLAKMAYALRKMRAPTYALLPRSWLIALGVHEVGGVVSGGGWPAEICGTALFVLTTAKSGEL